MITTLQIASRDQGVLFVESFEQRYYGKSPKTDAEAEALALATAKTAAPRRAPSWAALATLFAYYRVAH